MPKPCLEAELLRKIKAILAKRNAIAAERAKPPANVLVVEDDYTTIEDIRKAFRAGYRRLNLDIATTAGDALEKAGTFKPDIILSTEVLRGMNGDEMAALIRQMPNIHTTPVVLYDRTGAFDAMREYRYRMYGRVNEFVGRADGFTLYDTVCRLLDG